MTPSWHGCRSMPHAARWGHRASGASRGARGAQSQSRAVAEPNPKAQGTNHHMARRGRDVCCAWDDVCCSDSEAPRGTRAVPSMPFASVGHVSAYGASPLPPQAIRWHVRNYGRRRSVGEPQKRCAVWDSTGTGLRCMLCGVARSWVVLNDQKRWVPCCEFSPRLYFDCYVGCRWASGTQSAIS